MDYPVIALVGTDSETKNLLSNIRKNIPIDSNTQNFDNLTYYIHDINTKYYNIKVALLPLESISTVTEVSSKVKLEGILIYFNSQDKTFLENLPQYVDFVKSHPIELFILLCNELMDDSQNGITFKCIKDCYHKIDIIELDKSSCDDDDDEEASGYDELFEALKCTLWSNVSTVLDPSDETNFKNYSEEDDDEGSNSNSNSIENEINNFENLLSQVLQFRSNTSNMSRDDRLNSAQHFAEVFEKLLLQDEEVANLPKE